MDRVHEARDEAKLQRLMDSIQANGWQGAPLVADGEQLLNGAHRYEALYRLNLTSMTDDPEVCIDIREIVEDWDEQMKVKLGYDEETDCWGDGYWEAVADIIWELDDEIREHYGLDLE